jgi:hypothetical protein
MADIFKQAEFFKIAVQRSDRKDWFLTVAGELIEQTDGTKYFGHISFDTDPKMAGIWPERAARETLEIIRNTCRTARLMPATFGEWVDAPAAALIHP